MRNPIEFVSDLYDYNLQYYRWFMHRRLLFSEITAEDVKNSVKYDFLANKDYENVGKLITQTTFTGVSAGIGLGALQYGIDTTARNVKANKAFTKSLGVLAVATAIGVAYGSIVNLSSNFRGKKSDFANHSLAAFLSVPLSGAFAKTNKLQWGITNGVIAALLFGFLKTVKTGDFVQNMSAPAPEKVRYGLYSYQYKPK